MKVRAECNIKEELHLKIFSQLNDLRSWGVSPCDLKILASLYDMDFDILNSNSIQDYNSRMTVIFSKESKKILMEKLKMSYNTFNNGLSRLRKKGFIKKGNSLDEKLLFNLNTNVFSFTIEYLNGEEYIKYKNKKQKK